MGVPAELAEIAVLRAAEDDAAGIDPPVVGQKGAVRVVDEEITVAQAHGALHLETARRSRDSAVGYSKSNASRIAAWARPPVSFRVMIKDGILTNGKDIAPSFCALLFPDRQRLAILAIEVECHARCSAGADQNELRHIAASIRNLRKDDGRRRTPRSCRQSGMSPGGNRYARCIAIAS